MVLLLLVSYLFLPGFATNSVLAWSDIALDAIRFNASSPTVSSRALAIVGVAVHDALASVTTRYSAHAYALSGAPSPVSLDAVVIAAARTALAALYPNQVATFDAKYFADLDTLGESIEASNGVYVGTRVAKAVVRDRANDGNVPYVSYPGSTQPGMWRPTPPNFELAETPQWADMRPWCMSSDSEFRPPPPPHMTSALYAMDHNQIAKLGSKFNSTRTPEQTAIAEFWYDGPATDTPPGTWDTVSDQVSLKNGYDLLDSAYLGALMGMTLADCAIMGWDAKYTYGQWRPITAIRHADSVPTPMQTLIFDPNWEPLLSTPNWPDYVSDRAMFGGAATQLLARLFGDNTTFSIRSDALGNTRNYASFSSAAFEQGQSRVFGGSHFNHSCIVGIDYGRKVADWAFEHCIRLKGDVPTTKPSIGGHSPDHAGIIAGSVIGGTLGIIFIVLFAIFVFRKPTSTLLPMQEPKSPSHDFDHVE